jgi:hypothetical protein
VTDNDGATDTATHQVVISAPPSVSITAPANGSTVSGASVAIAASVTNAITANFYVDGILVGTQASGQPSGTWYASVLWDSTLVGNGTHTITVSAMSASFVQASATIQVNVANGPPPPPPLTLTGILPATMPAGGTVTVTVSGSGFQTGMSLTFASGSGGTPVAGNVVVLNASTLSATVSVNRSGRRGIRTWDVVVTRPDGQAATLVGGFTVVK